MNITNCILGYTSGLVWIVYLVMLEVWYVKRVKTILQILIETLKKNIFVCKSRFSWSPRHKRISPE